MSGNPKYFPQVDVWEVPTDAFRTSMEEMRRDGIDGNEGVALWLGRREGGAARVTHVVALRGPGVTRRPDLLRIESWLLNDVTDVAIELGVSLVGQIHSHGPFGTTDLSPTDVIYGVTVPYYLSVVAPDFAASPRTRIDDCGVHIYEPRTGYRRLSFAEVHRRVRLAAGVPAALLIIGN